MVPEALEHKGVIQQYTDASGEFRPNEHLDAARNVERTELFQKGFEGFLLGESPLLVNIRGIGRVKGDPQEDETAIDMSAKTQKQRTAA